MSRALLTDSAAISSLDRFLNLAVKCGNPRGQVENFLRAGVVLSEVQLKFSAACRMCDLPGGPIEIGFGGARGGGKSAGTVIQVCIDDCQRCPGLKVLILRKVGKANRENFADIRARLLMRLPHEWTRSSGILTFPNGSRVILGHYQNESDIDDYLGLEYDVIAIEESTQLSKKKLDAITTCNRTSKPNWRPRIYRTTNPGGLSHAAFKKQFVDPFRRGCETETRFIPALVEDNPFVDSEYKLKLDKLTGWLYRAWRKGDWDIGAGTFFTNWQEGVHVVKASNFTFTQNDKAWGALDYGFTHFTAAGLFRRDGDGNRFLVAEHGERKQLPTWHATQIHAMLARHDLTVKDLDCFVAGADVFAKRGTALTIAETYAENGIDLSSATMDRINGWGRILTGLGQQFDDDTPDVPPTLFIFDTCVRTIEQIPLLIHDPHRPEDVLKVDADEDTGEGGDDFADMFRYGLMADYNHFIDIRLL